MEHAPTGGEPQAAGRPNIPAAPDLELDPSGCARYPFLSKCSDTVLKKLQPSLSEKTFKAGETILRSVSTATRVYTWPRGSRA